MQYAKLRKPSKCVLFWSLDSYNVGLFSILRFVAASRDCICWKYSRHVKAGGKIAQR